MFDLLFLCRLCVLLLPAKSCLICFVAAHPFVLICFVFGAFTDSISYSTNLDGFHHTKQHFCKASSCSCCCLLINLGPFSQPLHPPKTTGTNIHSKPNYCSQLFSEVGKLFKLIISVYLYFEHDDCKLSFFSILSLILQSGKICGFF